MQVKKFEAKTMKEALEMVKLSLGPEAIILSAKDNRGGFGLKGQTSVQVTAAVTEEMLRKKQLAEQRLNQINRDKYQAATANRQRKFIDQVVDQYQKEQEIRSRTFTTTPYIDIGDEQRPETQLDQPVPQVQPQLAEIPVPTQSMPEPQAQPRPANVGNREVVTAQERIKGAAARALEGAEALFVESPLPQPARPSAPVRKKAITYDNGERVTEEISSLRKEIQRLKGLVKDSNLCLSPL